MGRTNMMTAYDVLRLRGTSSLTRAEIAQAAGVSTGTVSNILARARDADVSWPTDLDPAGLHRVLYPPVDKASGAYLEPDLESVEKALGKPRRDRAGTSDPEGSEAGEPRRRAPRMTRHLLWEEYCDEAAEKGLKAYSRSHFFGLLKAQIRSRRLNPEMRFDYQPGEWMMSDFSGKTLPICTRDGEVMAEILVCLLPYSGLTFAVAVPDQTLASWTAAHRSAFEYIGGVAERMICDNLRSAVTRWCEGEAELNKTFADFARHYGIAVLPACPGEPRHKGAVEGCVRILQTRVLARLRHESFFSIAELNQALRTGCDRLNDAVMQARGTSRRILFESDEASMLKELPAQPWVFKVFAGRVVGPNYHIVFDHNHYSVPSKWIGSEVTVKATSSLISIHLATSDELLAHHPRVSGRGRYTTTSTHMPSHHREMAHRQRPDYEEWLMGTLKSVGPHTGHWAGRCLLSKDFREQAYRALRGVVRLSETHSQAALEAACREALAQERFTSGRIRDLLKTPPPAAAEPLEERLPVHENIRGSAFFSTGTEDRS